jgi:hypothetical protein
MNNIAGWPKISGCLLVLALWSGVAGAATGDSTGWVSHSAVVRLSDLPRHYSCDDLQSRLRDLLLALGARPDMDIQASECGLGPADYSPRVNIQVSTPSQLLAAPSRTVRLAPGQLSSWGAADCELMRQLKDKLLPQLGVKTVAFSLACQASAVNSEHYRVIVQLPNASSDSAKVAAASTVPVPRSR